MGKLLSSRSEAPIRALEAPWRFVEKRTYDPDTNPSGLIMFAYAENLLILSEVEQRAKMARCCKQTFLYEGSSPKDPRFTAALATHLNEYLTPHEPIASSDIRLTGGATAMHELLAWAVADSRDVIMTSRPVYGRFELDFGYKAEVQILYANTDSQNCLEEGIVAEFERTLLRSLERGTNIRALLIVNPNNPLGKCYPRETLVRLLQFCQKHQIHLISDEIYACTIFDSGESDATPFTSILSIDTTGLIDKNLVHVIYGLSKDFGAPGLRVGALITKSKPLLRAVDAGIRFYAPSGASLAIGLTMLEDREWCRGFLDHSSKKLAAAYKHVTTALRELGIGYIRGSNAGFFILIDLSPYLPENLEGEDNPEFTLAKRLRDAGVYLHPREEHANEPGWFRLVYAQDPRTVTEGLNRVMSVIRPEELKL